MTWQQILQDGFSGENLWVALGAGVFFAGLVFLIGWLVTRRHHQEKPDSVWVRVKEGGKPSNAVLSNDFLFGMEMARRQSVRRKGNRIEVLIGTEPSQAKCSPGVILDRSMGGLCLLADESAEVGSILHVRTMDAPERVPWVGVEVKRCKKTGDGEFEIGCQYVTQPAGEVLDLFG